MVGVSTTPPPKCKEPFLKHVEKVVFGMKGGRAFTSFRNEFKHKAFARVGDVCSTLHCLHYSITSCRALPVLAQLRRDREGSQEHRTLTAF